MIYHPGCQRLFLARFPVFSRGFAARGFGQHRKFPRHARKTSGTQGNDLLYRKLGIVNWGFFLTIQDNFWAGTKTILDRANVHTQERWFRRDFCNEAKLCNADLERGADQRTGPTTKEVNIQVSGLDLRRTKPSRPTAPPGTLLDDLDVCERPGAPNVNFRKISVRKTIWDLEFSEHLL